MARSVACQRALALLALAIAFAVAPSRAGAGEPTRAPAAATKVAAIPALPISIAVAQQGDAPVVADRWVERQIAEANRLLEPHGVSVRQVRQRGLDPRFAALETPADRDTLAAEVEPRVINVFVVRSLRDIDRTERFIMGVRWRLRRNLAKDYVILSTKALPTTLAHELGHYLGNPHSPVDNNIMSYERSDPSAVCFDSVQGARMRQIARRNLRIGRLITADRYAELADRRVKPGSPPFGG